MGAIRSGRFKLAVTWAVACALTVGAAASVGSRSTRLPLQVLDDRPPNILLIVTDDQRFRTLWAMPKTSRWIFRGGTNFTNAFATTPLCCPARASMMTGRYAHNHGVLRNGQGRRLPHGATLQRFLGEAGFRTAIVGKFLNGWRPGDRPPYFDRWSVLYPPNRYSAGRVSEQSNGYRHPLFDLDGKVRSMDVYSTRYMGKRAGRYLGDFENDDDRPWFLYLAPYAPHPPAYPERRYRGTDPGRWKKPPSYFESNLSDKPGWVREQQVDPSKARWHRVRQLRSLRSADDMLERVRRRLEELGETQDTLVIFTSDNGFMWGEHGLAGKPPPYDESIRIPLVIRWPGYVAEGVTDRSLVNSVDLFPTILRAARLDRDSYGVRDGINLLGTRERDEMLIELFSDEGLQSWASLRSKTFQYIEYYDYRWRKTGAEFYDLDRDPHQLRNVIDEVSPKRVRALSRRLRAARDCIGRNCP